MVCLGISELRIALPLMWRAALISHIRHLGRSSNKKIKGADAKWVTNVTGREQKNKTWEVQRVIEGGNEDLYMQKVKIQAATSAEEQICSIHQTFITLISVSSVSSEGEPMAWTTRSRRVFTMDNASACSFQLCHLHSEPVAMKKKSKRTMDVQRWPFYCYIPIELCCFSFPLPKHTAP